MDIYNRFGGFSITNLVLFSRKRKIETQMSLKNKRHQFLKKVYYIKCVKLDSLRLVSNGYLLSFRKSQHYQFSALAEKGKIET